MLSLTIDIILGCGVLLLAFLSLFSRDLFLAIVLYISLGLLVTIAWARLDAWDVAIAEAAIGAGLTGALLLAAWHKIKEQSAPNPSTSEQSTPGQAQNVQ